VAPDPGRHVQRFHTCQRAKVQILSEMGMHEARLLTGYILNMRTTVEAIFDSL
jgi:hypothetical protein